jgi:ATP-dependent HslUV protease, peptidase subunit HslV
MTIQNSYTVSPPWHGTTIVALRNDKQVIIAGDGQVSMGSMIMKNNAIKVRKIAQDSVLVGFAGSTADAFTLLERLENKLEAHPKNLRRACVELAKDWRTDKYLRSLEAMLIVADIEQTLVLTGNGDVLEPSDPVVAIGSGGPYALAAAKGLMDPRWSHLLDIETVARKALSIAADICVYTNDSVTLEFLLIDKPNE